MTMSNESICGKNGVFSGQNSINAFLNPARHPFVPLVELPEELNPFISQGIRIFAKLMYVLPLLNLKSLQVLNMLWEARRKGELGKNHTLVENSSGNTGFSLAIIGRIFGIKKTIVIVPYDIAPGKLEMLRIAGAEVRFCKGPPEEMSGIDLAREIGKENGFLNLDQYGNNANPEAFEKWMAPQIWEQTEGTMSIFCAGLGTTGTIVGMSNYLKKILAKVYIVGVNLPENNAIPGVRTLKKLEEVSFPWNEKIYRRIEAGTKESFKKSLALCRAGLIAGPSSGFALAGLLKFLNEKQKLSDLDSFRNRGGNIVAVFICPDTPFPYLDKYSTILDPSDF